LADPAPRSTRIWSPRATATDSPAASGRAAAASITACTRPIASASLIAAKHLGPWRIRILGQQWRRRDEPRRHGQQDQALADHHRILPSDPNSGKASTCQLALIAQLAR
jgi:hypothetical protein